jgi:hypothetical protein
MVEYFVYQLKPGELTGDGPHPRHNHVVFIAYSFNSKTSREFRIKLEQNLRRSTSLCSVEIVDGHTMVGKKWATEVRGRLTKSCVVIADLSELSPEVLFECGFAWGIGKPILPVTENRGLISAMPAWLTDWQVGFFSSQDGWNELVDSLSYHISERANKRRRTPRSGADPGSIVLLKPHSGLFDFEDQVRLTATRYGMDAEYENTFMDGIEETTSELVERVAHCSLLVAPLLHHRSDSFVHFSCGVVAAAPMAGASSRRLNRRVLLVVESTTGSERLVSNSATRVSQIVRVITPNMLAQELTNYGQLFRRWRERQESDR